MSTYQHLQWSENSTGSWSADIVIGNEQQPWRITVKQQNHQFQTYAFPQLGKWNQLGSLNHKTIDADDIQQATTTVSNLVNDILEDPEFKQSIAEQEAKPRLAQFNRLNSGQWTEAKTGSFQKMVVSPFDNIEGMVTFTVKRYGTTRLYRMYTHHSEVYWSTIKLGNFDCYAEAIDAANQMINNPSTFDEYRE